MKRLGDSFLLLGVLAVLVGAGCATIEPYYPAHSTPGIAQGSVADDRTISSPGTTAMDAEAGSGGYLSDSAQSSPESRHSDWWSGGLTLVPSIGLYNGNTYGGLGMMYNFGTLGLGISPGLFLGF